jgi:hypothetical protein
LSQYVFVADSSKASPVVPSEPTNFVVWNGFPLNLCMGSFGGAGLINFFGLAPAVGQQPSVGNATAGLSYGGNEQSMLNAVYAALRNSGLIAR